MWLRQPAPCSQPPMGRHLYPPFPVCVIPSADRPSPARRTRRPRTLMARTVRTRSRAPLVRCSTPRASRTVSGGASCRAGRRSGAYRVACGPQTSVTLLAIRTVPLVRERSPRTGDARSASGPRASSGAASSVPSARRAARAQGQALMDGVLFFNESGVVF